MICYLMIIFPLLMYVKRKIRMAAVKKNVFRDELWPFVKCTCWSHSISRTAIANRFSKVFFILFTHYFTRVNRKVHRCWPRYSHGMWPNKVYFFNITLLWFAHFYQCCKSSTAGRTSLYEPFSPSFKCLNCCNKKDL